jgi:hypothetical protein
MKNTTLLAGVLTAAVLAAAATLSLAGTAYGGPTEPDVPSALEVPEGNKLFLVGRAVGVQIYSCNATTSGYQWGFVAPRADVYADNGKLLTTHFGGPTWLANDGSSVVGRVVSRADAGASAVPWLLLEGASTTVGAEGDRLAGTSYIQRLATSGGIAPAAEGCNEDKAGTTAEIPYTADYYFWKAIGH